MTGLDILIALALYGAFAADYPGTYQAFAAGGAIIRLDTRTGTMERCVINGTPHGLVMACEEIDKEIRSD